MKKSIVLGLFVCLAMSMNAYAQSDMSAEVIKKSEEGVLIGIRAISDDGDVVIYRGWAHFVRNSGGVINRIAPVMERVEGDYVFDKTFTGNGKSVDGTFKFNCVLNANKDIASCKFQNKVE